MIKISMDNLFFWKYFFGGGLMIVQAIFIVVVIAVNVWPIYLAYFLGAAGQLFFGKVWRYLLIKDVYLSSDFEKIEIKDSNNVIQEFERSDIVKCKTNHGISEITFDNSGDNVKFYFMVNSKENLKYLKKF